MRRAYPLALALAATFALTACGERGGGDGDGDAKVSVNTDGKNGKVSVNAPGVKLEVVDPDINLKADDFNIDGVKLYPGSTITQMNVESTSDTNKGKKSNVTVGFKSDANAKEVADWFDAEMKKAKFTTARSGYDISGTTTDGQKFSLKIGDEGGGKSSGTVNLSRGE